MGIQDQKLSRFEKAVFSEVDIKTAEIVADLDAYKQDKLAKVEDEQLEKSYHLIQAQINEFRLEFSRIMTREKLNAKQEILVRRTELVDGLFEKAAEKLREFSASTDYAKTLAEMLKPHGVAIQTAVLVIRPEDRDLFTTLTPGVQLKEDPTNTLGGFVIYDEGKNRYIDETFSGRLEQQKAAFYGAEDGSLSIG